MKSIISKFAKDSTLFIIVLVCSLLIGLISTFVGYKTSVNKIVAINSDDRQLFGIDEVESNLFHSVSDESGLVFNLNGQSVQNMRMTVTGFPDYDAENAAVVRVTADGETIYDSTIHNGPFGTHEFSVPRTIAIDKAVTIVNVTLNNANYVDVRVEFNVMPAYNWFQMWVTSLGSFLVLTIILCLKSRKLVSIELTMVTVIVLAGLISSLYVPPKYTYDEDSHYTRSYNNAVGNLIYSFNEPINYPKALDEVLRNPNWLCNSYDDYCNLISYNNQFKVNDTEAFVRDTPQVVYTPLPYYSSGIGVKIAQIFDLSLYRSVQLARFSNVLLFALIAFITIKIIPQKKLLFAFYFMLPINIFMAASLGTDYFINAFVALSSALVLRYKTQDRRMTTKEYIILLIVLSLIPCGKSPYAPFILIAALLSADELPQKISPKINCIIAFILMFLVFGATTAYGSRYGISHWNLENVSPDLQMDFMIHNPIKALYAYSNSFFDSLASNVIHKYYGFAYVGNYEEVGIFSMIGLAVLTFMDQESFKPVQIKWWNWIYWLMAIVGSYTLSWLALYTTFTEVGADMVRGFQARYCLSIALVIYFGCVLMQKASVKLNSDKIPYVMALALVTYNMWQFIIEGIGNYV